jgi:hypothetical protein
MSQWTHINGSIRIDYLQLENPDKEIIEDIKKHFGNICDFYSNREMWKNCNVPLGSEGSVQYDVQLTGDAHSLARVRIQIWGDLRNYENTEEIIEWIKQATKELIIRDGVIQIDVESKEKTILIWNDDKDEWQNILKEEKCRK